MDGKQRLEVLHGIFHPDGERFNFAWEWLPASGLSVKDFIAPSSFRFGEGYIAKLCTRTLKDDAGNTYSYVDEEMRNRLQVRLITRTLAFHVG